MNMSLNSSSKQKRNNNHDVNRSILLAKKIFNNFRSAWAFIIIIPLTVFVLDQSHFIEIIKIASSALVGTAPFILFAVLLIALLKAAEAESLISQIFQGRENRMIIFAALVGGLAPFCSCEVIPFIAGLLAIGTPISAVMAFWLSSPLIDPPSLLITAGVLGWKFAIAKTIAAVLLGIFGGYSVKLLSRGNSFSSPLRKQKTESSCGTSCCSTEQKSESKTLWRFWEESHRVNIFKEQLKENGLFLFKWLTFAYLLEALLITYIPAKLIGGFVGGDGFSPIILGALAGMPAYLNSYAAPPLVAGLMEQGMSAGSAMAFMIAGAISSIPAMTAVWSLVNKQVFAAYLLLGVTGAVIFGSAFSLFD